MGRRDQKFLCLLLSLETVLEREMGHDTVCVQTSDEMCIVVGHHPLEGPLPLYVAGQASVVSVCVEIHIEPATV